MYALYRALSHSCRSIRLQVKIFCPTCTIADRYTDVRYCIRASSNEIDRLMNGNLWPREVIVKEYTKLI